MKELTIQQKKVLQCIKFYIKKTGFPQTRADICRELGFKSPNAAESHLRALEKKSYITIENGASRGINLTDNSAEKSQTIPVIGLVAAGSPTLANENIEKIAIDIYKLVKAGHVLKCRKYMITNEYVFNNDYPLLLKMIFNVIDQSESDGAIKKAALSVVYDYLYKSAFVMDQEINAYACLIELDTMTN